MTDNRTSGSGDGSGLSQASSGRQDVSGGSVEEQLARAQERLAFYEGFDRLIQDNIARSAELMREAMDLRERAQVEIAQGHAEAARRVMTEREKQRLLFTSLLDELQEVRQSAERVARRVSQALEEIGAASAEYTLIGTSAEPPTFQPEAATDDKVEPFIVASPATVPPEPGPAASEPATGAAAGVEEEVSAAALTAVPEPATTGASGATALGETAPGEAGARSEPGIPVDRANAVQSPAANPRAMTSPDRAAEAPTAEPSAAPRAQRDSGAEQGSRVVMVLVHGVPRAAAALSLQRHLAGLADVDGVEAREYAEGILRLQVTARRPLDLDDLRSWDGGTDLEPVHIQKDVVEVKLPGAETF